MKKVYICLFDGIDAHMTPEAWRTVRIMKVFDNEEAAKNWINEQRNAHHSGNDGCCNQKDIFEKWADGEVYEHWYILGNKQYKVEFYYVEEKVEGS